ncbi:MAG: response regulator transcription factor [Treponema sp.]|nr:response regulator transcription factor [Treponema sp.]
MTDIFIVDDHSMLRNGLKSFLENTGRWKVTGTFPTGTECLSALAKCSEKDRPELIIIDIQLAEGETGFNLVKNLKSLYSEIKIVMYSMYNTWGFILQAKDLGVQGYISKVAGDEELLLCLENVKNGSTYYEKKSESIQTELSSILSVLKKQERIVFEMVLQGKSNRQISDELFISLHTVENYISYLIKLSDCKKRDELIEKYK